MNAAFFLLGFSFVNTAAAEDCAKNTPSATLDCLLEQQRQDHSLRSGSLGFEGNKAAQVAAKNQLDVLLNAVGVAHGTAETELDDAREAHANALQAQRDDVAARNEVKHQADNEIRDTQVSIEDTKADIANAKRAKKPPLQSLLRGLERKLARLVIDDAHDEEQFQQAAASHLANDAELRRKVATAEAALAGASFELKRVTKKRDLAQARVAAHPEKKKLLKKRMRRRARYARGVAVDAVRTTAASGEDKEKLLGKAATISCLRRRRCGKKAEEPARSSSPQRVARVRRGTGLQRVVVDRYGNQKPGYGLGLVNTQDPVEGEALQIDVETQTVFDIGGWASKPESFDKTTVLNPIKEGKVQIAGGDVYLWHPGSTLDDALVLVDATADFEVTTRWNGRAPVLPTTTAATLSASDGTKVDFAFQKGARCPKSGAHTLDSTGDSTCLLRLVVDGKGKDLKDTTTWSWSTDGGKTTTPVKMEKVSGRTLKADAEAKSKPCTEDERLTARAIEHWSAPKELGHVFRCGIEASIEKMSLLDDSRQEIFAVDVERNSIQSVELHLEATGRPTTTYTRNAADVVGASASFSPRLDKGTSTLKVRVLTDDGAQPSARAVGDVKAIAEAETPGPVQVHVGTLARDAMRSIILTAMVSPEWFPRAYEDLANGRASWLRLYTPKPTAGIRVALDRNDPVGVAFGVAQPLAPGLNFVGGLEAGTRHITERWKPERAWFIGITFSPAVYDKMIRTINERRK